MAGASDMFGSLAGSLRLAIARMTSSSIAEKIDGMRYGKVLDAGF